MTSRIVPTKNGCRKKLTARDCCTRKKKMTIESKIIASPVFIGKDDDFEVWWTKFKAFAKAKGFVAALLGRESDLPTSEGEDLDNIDPDEARMIKVRNRNSLAMAYLLSAFKAQLDISLAYEAKDDDWLGGLAFKVVEQLVDILKPDDNISEVELYLRLLKVKMKTKEDPKKLFDQANSELVQFWIKKVGNQLDNRCCVEAGTRCICISADF